MSEVTVDSSSQCHVLLFMSPYVLSLCLYLCGRASGGLILIARQASKCLCRVSFLFAFASDNFSCYFAWQIITIRFVTDLALFLCQLLFLLLSFDLSCDLSAAGCSASWQGGQAVQRRTSVTCLQRWTPSSQLWPLSTLSTKSCLDLSYTDESIEEFKNP